MAMPRYTGKISSVGRGTYQVPSLGTGYEAVADVFGQITNSLGEGIRREGIRYGQKKGLSTPIAMTPDGVPYVPGGLPQGTDLSATAQRNAIAANWSARLDVQSREFLSSKQSEVLSDIEIPWNATNDPEVDGKIEHFDASSIAWAEGVLEVLPKEMQQTFLTNYESLSSSNRLSLIEKRFKHERAVEIDQNAQTHVVLEKSMYEYAASIDAEPENIKLQYDKLSASMIGEAGRWPEQFDLGKVTSKLYAVKENLDTIYWTKELMKVRLGDQTDNGDGIPKDAISLDLDNTARQIQAYEFIRQLSKGGHGGAPVDATVIKRLYEALGKVSTAQASITKHQQIVDLRYSDQNKAKLRGTFNTLKQALSDRGYAHVFLAREQGGPSPVLDSLDQLLVHYQQLLDSGDSKWREEADNKISAITGLLKNVSKGAAQYIMDTESNARDQRPTLENGDPNPNFGNRLLDVDDLQRVGTEEARTMLQKEVTKNHQADLAWWRSVNANLQSHMMSLVSEDIYGAYGTILEANEERFAEDEQYWQDRAQNAFAAGYSVSDFSEIIRGDAYLGDILIKASSGELDKVRTAVEFFEDPRNIINNPTQALSHTDVLNKADNIHLEDGTPATFNSSNPEAVAMAALHSYIQYKNFGEEGNAFFKAAIGGDDLNATIVAIQMFHMALSGRDTHESAYKLLLLESESVLDIAGRTALVNSILLAEPPDISGLNNEDAEIKLAKHTASQAASYREKRQAQQDADLAYEGHQADLTNSRVEQQLNFTLGTHEFWKSPNSESTFIPPGNRLGSEWAALDAYASFGEGNPDWSFFQKIGSWAFPGSTFAPGDQFVPFANVNDLYIKVPGGYKFKNPFYGMFQTGILDTINIFANPLYSGDFATAKDIDQDFVALYVDAAKRDFTRDQHMSKGLFNSAFISRYGSSVSPSYVLGQADSQGHKKIMITRGAPEHFIRNFAALDGKVWESDHLGAATAAGHWAMREYMQIAKNDPNLGKLFDEKNPLTAFQSGGFQLQYDAATSALNNVPTYNMSIRLSNGSYRTINDITLKPSPKLGRHRAAMAIVNKFVQENYTKQSDPLLAGFDRFRAQMLVNAVQGKLFFKQELIPFLDSLGEGGTLTQKYGTGELPLDFDNPEAFRNWMNQFLEPVSKTSGQPIERQMVN